MPSPSTVHLLKGALNICVNDFLNIAVAGNMYVAGMFQPPALA
jgi:hypothetical protein